MCGKESQETTGKKSSNMTVSTKISNGGMVEKLNFVEHKCSLWCANVYMFELERLWNIFS